MIVGIVAIAVGIVLGFIGGPAWILIIWGIAAFLVGYFSKNSKQSLINGFIFGFAASFFFMVHGYSGTAPLFSRIPFFILISIFGGVCGLAGSFVGSYLHKKFFK